MRNVGSQMRSVRVKDESLLIAPALSLVALIGLALIGCRDAAAPAGNDALARRQVSLVAMLYGQYLQSHNNLPPADEAAFRSFLNEYGGSRLKEYNIDNLDKLLTSPRDGQPFGIVYGKRLAPADSPGTPWAAYEKTGVDGKRLAAQARGATVELTPEQFAATFP
jgi:hypothetical protein